MLYLLTFAIFFAFLDRLSGGWPNVPGRGQYYAPLFVAVTLAIGLGAWVGLATAIAFMVWRMPAWSLFGGNFAPWPHEYKGTLLRHTLAPVALIVAWLLLKQEFNALMIIIAVAFPFFATAVGIVNRSEAEDGYDINAGAEFLRGAGFGVMASTPFIGLG